MERVGGFMGLDTLLFPPDSHLQRQPKLMVRDNLQDVFELRNIIAHGQEIPKQPYLELYPLITANGDRINQEPLLYRDVLHEACLFLLTGALRKILTEGLYDKVADQRLWKAELKIYEYRYKKDGGPTVVKQRSGR